MNERTCRPNWRVPCTPVGIQGYTLSEGAPENQWDKGLIMCFPFMGPIIWKTFLRNRHNIFLKMKNESKIGSLSNYIGRWTPARFSWCVCVCKVKLSHSKNSTAKIHLSISYHLLFCSFISTLGFSGKRNCTIWSLCVSHNLVVSKY